MELRRGLRCAVAAGLLWSAAALAAEPVKVGGYEFAPFVELDASGHAGGLTIDLLALLNRSQRDYSFQFVTTSPSRRYRDFEERRFDLIAFESIDWGWADQKLPVDASRVFLTGGERYVATAQPGRGQDYFDDLAHRRLVGIRGYHYGFAGFEADPVRLAQRFELALVNDNEASIEMILRGRGDVAVVTDLYLGRYLIQHPAARPQLLISDRFDQAYRHTILVRRGSKPDVREIDALLGQLEASGRLAGLFASYGASTTVGANQP